ncbi:MAG: hypothetical protein ACREYC_24190, partial [Gammaproteobacteria bacterium]
FLWCDRRQAAYRHLFRYHLDEEMVSELRLAVNQNQPSGTIVSMRRLSAWLGSVARRDREGGRAMLRMKKLKGRGTWAVRHISSLAPLTAYPCHTLDAPNQTHA